jgi:putative membrane protein
MWFATSVIIHDLIYYFRPKINSKISFVLFLAQLFFFGVLYVVIG